jgi:hypothetical protein
LLKTTMPTAPALDALVALSPKVQEMGKPAGAPRWTSAMLPAGKPAQSLASQPVMTFGECTAAVTSAEPEYEMIVCAIGPAGGGETCSRIDGASDTNVWNSNAWRVTA